VVANLSHTITVLARGAILAEGPYAEVSKIRVCSSVCRDHGGRGCMTSALRPTSNFLRVTDLHAFYGDRTSCIGIDFVVNRGEVVTLLGRNGAGRTTTLRASSA